MNNKNKLVHNVSWDLFFFTLLWLARAMQGKPLKKIIIFLNILINIDQENTKH